MSLLAVETGMSENFEKKIRDDLERFRSAIIRGALTMLVGFGSNVGWGIWQWSATTAQVNENSRRLMKAEERLQLVSEEQLRRTSNINAVAELAVEMRALRTTMQEVRDDVLILKTQKQERPE